MTNYAVEILTQPTEIAQYSKNRTAISMFNNGSVTVFVSQDQIGILSEGYPLEPGASLTIKGSVGTSSQEAVWGQTSAIACELRVKEVYLGEDISVTSAPPTVAGSVNEFQQLEDDSKAGSLILLEGSVSAPGSIVSYTPAVGVQFTEYVGSIQSNDPTNTCEADIRNATSIREHGFTTSGNLRVVYITKGDSLLGDGTKAYDIHATTVNGGLLYGALEGIIE